MSRKFEPSSHMKYFIGKVPIAGSMHVNTRKSASVHYVDCLLLQVQSEKKYTECSLKSKTLLGKSIRNSYADSKW